MTTLLLVRHGLSEANAKGFFAGQMDVPLLEIGQQQAELTARHLTARYHIDKIYASDLQRAYDTGLAAGKMLHMDVIWDPRLREIYAGNWQGVAFDTLVARYPEGYKTWRQDIGHAHPDGGESVAQMGQRFVDALTDLARENPGKTLLIATHATPIRAMQCYVANGSFGAMKDIPWVSNASYCVLTYDGGIWKFEAVSQDAHLADLKTVFPGNV